MKKIILTEEQFKKYVETILSENRKVIKLPSQNQAPMDMNMGMDNMQQAPMDGAMQDANIPPMGGADANMPADNNVMPDNTQSEFDTNFDAGVEADEDSDPKKYIQQLTGKLSQTLNSYINNNGDDADLCKYVASMIVTAACKNLDETAKKDIIEKINTSESDNGGEEIPQDGGTDMNQSGGEEIPMNGEAPAPEENGMNISEMVITKKQIAEMFTKHGEENSEETLKTGKDVNKCPKAWQSKFNK